MDEKTVNHVVEQEAHGERQHDRGNSRQTHSSRLTHNMDKRRKLSSIWKEMQKMWKKITIFKKCARAGNTVCICSKRSLTQTFSDEFLAFGREPIQGNKTGWYKLR